MSLYFQINNTIVKVIALGLLLITSISFAIEPATLDTIIAENDACFKECKEKYPVNTETTIKDPVKSYTDSLDICGEKCKGHEYPNQCFKQCIDGPRKTYEIERDTKEAIEKAIEVREQQLGACFSSCNKLMKLRFEREDAVRKAQENYDRIWGRQGLKPPQ